MRSLSSEATANHLAALRMHSIESLGIASRDHFAFFFFDAAAAFLRAAFALGECAAFAAAT